MGLIDEYNASLNSLFIQKCQMAAITFSIEVVQKEPANTPNHANRVAYARQVVNNPTAVAGQLAQGVSALLNLTDPPNPTDTDINNSVATIWDMYAGIS